MTDTWLDELYQMHNEDKAKQQTLQKSDPLDLSVLSKNRVELAAAVMRSVNAHNLIRRLQSALLGGKGIIYIFDSKDDYDRVISLVWQGPISNARKPNPEDPTEYQYISVGARGKRLYVNDQEVSSLTPEALKKALVEAAKKPGKIKRGNQTKK
ncbi:MAG: hypothetical protein HS126_04890 [Anaerolineales bacterium]|nr:hypothetical protein [Anaerolineales bacterium]